MKKPPELSATERRVLEQLLTETVTFMASGDLDGAESSAAEAAELGGEDPRVLALQGELAWARGRDAEARALLERAVEAAPDAADAHHLLARIHEDAGDRVAMIEHDLRVLEIDAAADARDGIGSAEDLRVIEASAREILDALPERFAQAMHNVPVVLEARPSEGLVRDGFDPRALGLFEGVDVRGGSGIGTFEPMGADLRPTRIVLYYANLLASCVDEDELAEQIEVTILHEIGHFFGLDEDEVAALGLE